MKHNLSIFLLTVILMLSLTKPVNAAGAYSLIGDADSDGDVTVLDATRIQRTVASLASLNTLQRYLADVDGSGEVSVIDATIIQRRIAEIDDGFCRERLEHWRADITTVSMPNSSAPPAEGASIGFYIHEESHVIPSEYEIYVNDRLLRERSFDAYFSYTFSTAGTYLFDVYAYDPFGGFDVYRFEMNVLSKVALKPKITSAVYNKNTKILSVIAEGGTAPYEYQYIIRNNVCENPPGGYVSPATSFEYAIDENGIPILKSDFSGWSAVDIPTNRLTKTLNYTCEVQVRDADGVLSEICYVPITL